MTANVTFYVKELTDVVLVPAEAVAEWPKNIKRPEGAEFAIYKKTFGGKLEPIPVKIGESDGCMTEITQGLEAGTAIEVVRKKEQASSVNPFTPFGGNRQSQKRNNS